MLSQTWYYTLHRSSLDTCHVQYMQHIYLCPIHVLKGTLCEARRRYANMQKPHEPRTFQCASNQVIKQPMSPQAAHTAASTAAHIHTPWPTPASSLLTGSSPLLQGAAMLYWCQPAVLGLDPVSHGRTFPPLTCHTAHPPQLELELELSTWCAHDGLSSRLPGITLTRAPSHPTHTSAMFVTQSLPPITSALGS